MGAPQEIRGFEGNLLGVTNRNMARAQAMTLSHQADLTIFQARTFAVVDTQTPGAGQNFFYFLNGSNRSQIIMASQFTAVYPCAQRSLNCRWNSKACDRI